MAHASHIRLQSTGHLGCKSREGTGRAWTDDTMDGERGMWFSAIILSQPLG